MPDFINAADVGLAVLQNNPTFKTVYPNKVFDYMACARPVAVAIDGVARHLVCDEAQAGLFAEPENPAEIAEVLVALAGDPAARLEMGRHGRQWVLNNATRPALAARYLRVMEEMINGDAYGSKIAEAK
jgi:glycosyltransferase involved in cell wall biosynthesis